MLNLLPSPVVHRKNSSISTCLVFLKHWLTSLPVEHKNLSSKSPFFFRKVGLSLLRTLLPMGRSKTIVSLVRIIFEFLRPSATLTNRSLITQVNSRTSSQDRHRPQRRRHRMARMVLPPSQLLPRSRRRKRRRLRLLSKRNRTLFL
jgi:hypothetical protein